MREVVDDVPRPKEAILSRSLIRDQALALIDEDGLGALTMRKLAGRLGVQAASLYTHFPNKEAVLDAIADQLARRIDPTGFADSWQDGLRNWANSYYTAVHWHPRAASVLAVGARQRAGYQAMAAQVHNALLRHGWPNGHATMVAAAAEFLVLGAATTASGEATTASGGTPQRADDWPPDQATGFSLDRFADTVDRASFTLALDSLIRGLEPVYDSLRA